MTSFLDRLRDPEPLLLDGATGTELTRCGVATTLPLWSTAAILDAPDVLEQIHRDYAAAGAEVITANTFRTHERNIVAGGLLVEDAARLTRRAVDIARRGAGSSVWIAGSLAPLEDCYSPELTPEEAVLRREHQKMAENLAAAGVDLILVETHNTIVEAVAATQAAASTGLPVLVSFVCGTDGRLLSGESVTDAAATVVGFQPAGVLVNCGPAPDLLSPVKALLSVCGETPVGAYGNIGRPDAAQGWVNTDAVAPTAYARFARTWLDAGATIIGGCCGTTPEHIRVLREALRSEA